MHRNNDQLGFEQIDGAISPPSPIADGIRGKPHTNVLCQRNKQLHNDKRTRGIQQWGGKKTQTLTVVRTSGTPGEYGVEIGNEVRAEAIKDADPMTQDGLLKLLDALLSYCLNGWGEESSEGV